MGKSFQIIVICMLTWITFFPLHSLSAESLQDGCENMAFHIPVIKDGDESIEGTAESGSEIALEIGAHVETTQADADGHFKFGIRPLEVSEGDSVTLRNGQHEIDTEVMEMEAEDTVIESVLQGNCKTPEEPAEEDIQEEEIDEPETMKSSTNEAEKIEEVNEEVEEVEETDEKEALETTEEKADDEPFEQSDEHEQSIDVEEDAVEEIEEAHEGTVPDETLSQSVSEEPLKIPDNVEEESIEVQEDEMEEAQETNQDILSEKRDEEEVESVNEEHQEENEVSIDEQSVSLFSATASKLNTCPRVDGFIDMDECLLQAELADETLILTYTGRGGLRKSNPNAPDKYINFYLPQEINWDEYISGMILQYIVPTAGQSGKTTSGELKGGFGGDSHHISVNIDSILHNSNQDGARYEFTIEINLNSLSETKEHKFCAGISEGSQAPSDGLPCAELSFPGPPGHLKFHEVPDSMAFETTNIEASTEEVLVKRDEDWKMTVEDTRGAGSDFHVTAEITQPLTTRDGTHSLPEALVYVDEEGHSQSTEEAFKVFSDTTGDEPVTSLSWPEDEGLMIQVNPISVMVEEYNTTINWTLSDGP